MMRTNLVVVHGYGSLSISSLINLNSGLVKSPQEFSRWWCII